MPDAAAPHPPAVIHGMEGLHRAIGTELGSSSWWTLTDEALHAVGADGSALPVLLLGPKFNYEIVSFEGFTSELNYGYDSIRFSGTVNAGTRVRMRLRLEQIVETSRGVRAHFAQTFEADGSNDPVCVAKFILFLGR